MICGRCGTDTVAWVGDLLNPTGTRCSGCGGVNCQRAEEPSDEEPEPDCAECGDTGVVVTPTQTYEPGCFVPHDDEIDVPCPICREPDPDYQRDLMLERRAFAKECPDAE